MNFLRTTLGALFSLAGCAALGAGVLWLVSGSAAWRSVNPALYETWIPWWVLPVSLPLLWIGFVLRYTREEIIRECLGPKKIRLDKLIPDDEQSVSRGHLVIPFLWPFFLCWWLVTSVHSHQLPFGGIPQALLWTLLLVAGGYFIILFHELGHLLVGKAAGMTILGADIGAMPTLFTINFRKCFLRINANPWSGMAYVYPELRTFYRLRDAAMLMGGPLFHFVAVAIFAAFFLLGWGPGHGSLAGAIAWIGLYILFAGSLLPRVHVAPINFPSDAYQFCGVFLFSEEDIAVSLAHARTCSAASPRPHEDAGAVLARLQALQSEYPDFPLLRFYTGCAADQSEEWATAEVNFRKARNEEAFESGALYFIEDLEIRSIAMQGRLEEARKRCDEVLSSDRPKEKKIELLDQLACLPIMQNLAGSLAEADRWSAHALDLEPSSLTLQGTRGSILVEMERFAEGREMLAKVREQSKSKTDQGIASFYLAIVELRTGRREAAAPLLKEAITKHPADWLVKRALALKQEIGT